MKRSAIIACCLAVFVALSEAIPTSVLANSKALTENRHDEFFTTSNVGVGGFAGGAAAVVAAAPSSTDGQNQQQPPQQQKQPQAQLSAPPSPPASTDSVQVRAAPQKRGAILNTPEVVYAEMSAANAANAAANARNQRNNNWYPAVDGVWGVDPNGALDDNINANDDADDDDINDSDPMGEQSDEFERPYLLPGAFDYPAALRSRQSLQRPTAYDNLQTLLNADMQRSAGHSMNGQAAGFDAVLKASAMPAGMAYDPYYYHYDASVERRRRRKRRSTLAAANNKRFARDVPLSAAELMQMLALTEAVQQQHKPTPISSGLSPFTEDLVLMIDPRQFQQQRSPLSAQRWPHHRASAAYDDEEAAMMRAAGVGGGGGADGDEWADGPIDEPSVQYGAGAAVMPMSYYRSAGGNVRHRLASAAGKSAADNNALPPSQPQQQHREFIRHALYKRSPIARSSTRSSSSSLLMREPPPGAVLITTTTAASPIGGAGGFDANGQPFRSRTSEQEAMAAWGRAFRERFRNKYL